MNVGSSDAISRVAAIQQMAASLGVGQPAGGFSTALQAASTDATGASTATANTSAPVSGTKYSAEINAAATKYGIDPALLAGLVKQESGFNPNATSGAGAKGLTQLMPATAKALGVTDPSDPVQSLEGGAKYLKQMLDQFGGDEKLALAAYNAGPGAVKRFGGIPPYAETQNYVKNVLANRDAILAQSVGTATMGSASATGAALNTAATTASALSGGTTTSVGTSASLAALDTSSSSSTDGSSSGLGYPTT
jgi:soluble lytic murein transglycosylase-like protein